MRIVGGVVKGRKLRVPASGTRPMTGRAKESVFSILLDHIQGAHVLDLYAGSGALGLESLSRGADDVVFVERSVEAVDTIKRNVKHVGLGGHVISGSVLDVLAWVDGPFDLVFVDPPYAIHDREVTEILAAVGRVVSPDAVIVLHRQAQSLNSPPDFLTCRDERRYGDASVTLYEVTSA